MASLAWSSCGGTTDRCSAADLEELVRRLGHDLLDGRLGDLLAQRLHALGELFLGQLLGSRRRGRPLDGLLAVWSPQ